MGKQSELLARECAKINCTAGSAVNCAADLRSAQPLRIASADLDKTSSQHLTAAAAEEFYRKECRSHDVSPNHTFTKQLLAGGTVFDFENGYLGEKGIILILATLQKLPVVELSMRGCELSSDDVVLIYKTFVLHETIQKIDLRDIHLSMSSARKLLNLAVENSGVKQILVNEDTPKYLYIQKQCFANTGVEIPAELCLVCRRSVIHTSDQQAEGPLLLSLGEGFTQIDITMGVVGLYAMFSSILACCKTTDGVIFLCSSECLKQLADDILTLIRAVVHELFSGCKGTSPRNPILRRCMVDILKRLQGKISLQRSVPLSSKTAYASDRCCTVDSSDETIDKGSDNELDECIVCGAHIRSLPNVAHIMMKQICDDIKSVSSLQPSQLLRLTRAIVNQNRICACSKECVVHFVRFEIYGYGGVLHSGSVTGDMQLSSLGIPLMDLPGEDFSILNLSMACIDDMEGEDTCCALTVASVMSDIDGVTIDPYMVFAVGRHLAKLPPETLGLELRHACNAVMVVGCLPVGMGPFDRRKEKPLRDLYVSWQKWSECADLDRLVRIAFSRRRQGVYAVDGPHSNLFDNIRAALWAFRKQKRAVLVVMRFCMEWLITPRGVISNETPIRKAFLTTLKIVGQVNIDNTFYIICQANFGSHLGNGGFFYISRSIFNLHVIGSAYIFVDMGEFSACRGEKTALYAARVLPKKVIDLIEDTPFLQELTYYCDDMFVGEELSRLDNRRIMSEVFRRIPPALSFSYHTSLSGVTHAQVGLLKTLRQMCLTDASRSQRLFFFTEVLGPMALEWLDSLTHHLALLPPHSLMLQRAVEMTMFLNTERKQSHLKWNSVNTTKMSAPDAPQRPERRMGKKPLSRRVTVKSIDASTVKITVDSLRARLERNWATLRDKKDSFKRTSQSDTRSSFLVDQTPSWSVLSIKPSAQTMVSEIDSVSLELVGQPWSAISLCDADGGLTNYVVFFIKDHVCCFNFANKTLVFPLHPARETKKPCNFPFPTGFDCALNSPVNPRTAYFFCGEQWIEWDTYRQVCIGGPYKLHLHRQFQNLPQEFLCGIDAAVPVPNSSCVLFFSQLKYVAFDLLQRQIVGKVKEVGKVEMYGEDTPVFAPALANLFPYGPMATLLVRVPYTGESEGIEEVDKTEENKRLAVKLIGPDGSVVMVHRFSPSLSLPLSKIHSLSALTLLRLPLALRQMTLAALSSVCENVLKAECVRSGVVVNSEFNVSCPVDAITSTLTRQREEVDDLLVLTRRDIASSSMPLLRDEVVFVQTVESMLDDPPQVIEVDYGATELVAFGALVLVLNTSSIKPRVFQVAPIEAVVESSDDGVTYIQHMHFLATPYVTALCWGEAHVARFWRLRFVTRLPIGTGVVRLLWKEVERVLGTHTLDPTVSLVPSELTEITISAPRIFSAPKDFLNRFSLSAVFASSTTTGWFEPHCVLPLLPDGAFCLMFCGSSFVELDCENGVVVSRRGVSLAHHPAFSNLPHTFLGGITAAFYPDLSNPHIVALVHENEIILWNLQLGLVEGGDAERPLAFFEGMPWSMDQVEDIVQIWDHPGEVFVIRSPEVLRWSITTVQIVQGPMLLKDCPFLYHPSFDGKPILCATSFPNAPEKFYVFCEDRVATQTVLDDVVFNTVGPKPVREFDFFAPILWYLKWGKRRYDCVIHLDFREEHPLLVGVVMQSSEPCNEEWIIECSDDGVEWSRVGCHRQCSGSSRTAWGLSGVGDRCHRFWCLTTDASMKQSREEPSVLYTSLSFLTLPSVPYRLPPDEIALSGTLNGPMSALFLDEKATLAFETPINEKSPKSPSTHYITLDYGEVNPPDLMAFACQHRGVPINTIWSSWCSNDGEHWENCGAWRNGFCGFKASWMPRGPHRYWRIELQLWEQSALYEKLSFFEFIGPSLALQNAVSSCKELNPSLLLEKPSEYHQIPVVKFSAQVGASLILDAKQNFVNVVGVRVVTHPHQVTLTKFAIEHSSNATDWLPLNETLLLRGGSVQTAWECNDFYRFWRLRVVQHSGPPLLNLSVVSFQTSRPSLYYAVKSVVELSKTTPSLQLNLGLELKEVVCVEALLPPRSVYVVEKLSVGDYTWEEVTRVENSDTMSSRTVRKAWAPQGYSTNWRLRRSVVDDSCLEEYPAFMSLESLDASFHVTWYTFSGTTIFPSNFTDNPLLQVSTTGFVELQAATRLTDNRSDTVVLRSIDEESHAGLSWFFGQNRKPCFHQVIIKGRTATNPNLPPPQTLPQQENQLNNGGLGRKFLWRRVGGGETASNNVSVMDVASEEAKMEKEIVLTIVVETSNNGVDYLPIAAQPFSQPLNALSWRKGVAASYWRIRFDGISKTDYLELREVTWLVERGISAILPPRNSLTLSRLMFDRLQSSTFNREEEFCRMCREGYDQAKSVASGLREPEDIERHGLVAQRISRLRGEFKAFVSKVSKGATKDQNLPDNKYISIGRSLGNDIMYLLYKATKRYGSTVDELNELIAHPMLFGFTRATKEGISWFYPKMEVSGTLVESFYGFHNVCASFTVLWSLSRELQQNTDLLYDRSINPLNPHIASVLIVVNIKQKNWLAAENFPGLPLLYFAGFTERPVVIVFALNQMTFTSTYNLTIPERDPFPANYPFHLLPGANFVQNMPLTSCPCPIFDRLQLLYSREFLAKHPTEVVFSVPTMHSKTATVRFTLPGAGIDLSISGLCIESIEFEVFLFMDADADDEECPSTSTMCSISATSHRITFVTHGCVLEDPYDNALIPLTLAGCIDNNEDKITMFGTSSSALFLTQHSFPDAFVTSLNLSFTLVSGDSPQSFLPPLCTIDGTLTTPVCGSYLCRFHRVSWSHRYETVSIQVSRLQLVKFIRLGDFLVTAPVRTEDVDWMQDIPIFLSVEMKLNYLGNELTGHGFIEVSGSRGEASVTISMKSIEIVATLTTIRFGGIMLQGRPEEGGITVSIALPLNGSSFLRLEGYSSLLSPQLYPTRIEISQAGIMCSSIGVFYDVCIEEKSFFPSGMSAQVSVSVRVINECLSELLQETPLIIALLSNGIPFAFLVENVLVEECMLDRQVMFLSVHGLLFGCRFSVMTSVVHPENTMNEARRVCEGLVPQILEQCDGPIWAAYDAFVGFIERPGFLWGAHEEEYDDESDNPARGNSAHSGLARYLVEEPKGRFLAHWMSHESEQLNVPLKSAVELGGLGGSAGGLNNEEKQQSVDA